MKKRVLAAIGAVACIAAAATPAHAGPRDFVIYAPGMGGTAADARPYLDTFFKYLEKKLGWPEKSGAGEYVDDPRSVADFIEKSRPGFGLVPPSYYLELACRKAPVTLLASVVGVNKGTDSGKYHLVVKKGTARTLDDLKGKRLASNHLQDLRFVSRVVFDGKVDAQKHFVLQPTNSPIKPFKAVDRGEADAALVDDSQLNHMKTLPFAQNLDVLFSSRPLPPFPVIAFDKVVKPADRDALKKALLEMCASKEGAETCSSLTITRFEKVDPRAYADAIQRSCKP